MKYLTTFIVAFIVFSCVITAQTNSYTINRGDVLDVVVMQHPEFSISGIIVLPDGTIQYPGLGSIVAAGMSSTLLRDTMAIALNRFIVDPVVTIYVRKIQSEKINIFGYVNNPGQFQIFEGIDLFSALSMAGGIKNIKRAKKITIIRLDNTILEIKVKDFFGHNGLHTKGAPYIQVGETLYVYEPREVNWSRLSFITTALLTIANIINILL